MKPILALLLALAEFLAHAEEPLRVYTIDVAPYGYINATGIPDGVLAQLATKISNRSGLPFIQEVVPPARLYALAQHNMVDLWISSIDFESRYKSVKLGKLFEMQGLLAFRKDRPSRPHQAEDFAGQRIIRVNGTCPTLDKIPGLHIINTNTIDQGLNLVFANRADALCAEKISLDSAMARHHEYSATFAEPLIFMHSAVWAFANPRLPASMIAKLRAAVTQIAQENHADTNSLEKKSMHHAGKV